MPGTLPAIPDLPPALASRLPNLSRLWKRGSSKPAPAPGDPMVNQAQLVAALGQAPPDPVMGAGVPGGVFTPPSTLNAGNPYRQASDGAMVREPIVAAFPPGPMMGGDAPAGMPSQLRTPDPYQQALANYNPSAPNPGVPQLPNPQNDYKAMIARLAFRAQNRADLYSQVMNPAIANLPPELKQVYAASIPDVQTNLNSYTDALANSATIAPELETILAQQDAVLKAAMAGSGAGGGDFTGLNDPELQKVAAEKAGKKKG